MLIALMTAWIAYKKAKENGRNGWLWALIAAVVFIGTQTLTVLLLGVGLEVMVVLGQAHESIVEELSAIVSVVAFVASFGASWFVFRYLDRPILEADELGGPPPPPPNFE
ncbi:MAG: hypothetical protein QUS14_17515 [Pyrinomonadaceae bacterium]|nr:hypothetical protein [Pyrinomonadaceae bacterium]